MTRSADTARAGRVTPLMVAAIAAALTVGMAAGLGAYTFVYAKGYSYMGNDPATCMNCHVMKEQFEAWTRSSHHAVATCNDCHAPHDLVGKYRVKATNGYHHSLAFTTGEFADPIHIKPGNRAVTEAQCRHCHADIVHGIDTSPKPGEEMSCVRCHASVGHMH